MTKHIKLKQLKPSSADITLDTLSCGENHTVRVYEAFLYKIWLFKPHNITTDNELTGQCRCNSTVEF